MGKKEKPSPNVSPVKDNFETALRQVAATYEGRVVLRGLMEELGYKQPSIVANRQTGEICPTSTIYNEARRNVWINFRKKIPIAYLNIIEEEREKPHAPQPEVEP